MSVSCDLCRAPTVNIKAGVGTLAKGCGNGVPIRKRELVPSRRELVPAWPEGLMPT